MKEEIKKAFTKLFTGLAQLVGFSIGTFIIAIPMVPIAKLLYRFIIWLWYLV